MKLKQIEESIQAIPPGDKQIAAEFQRRIEAIRRLKDNLTDDVSKYFDQHYEMGMKLQQAHEERMQEQKLEQWRKTHALNLKPGDVYEVEQSDERGWWIVTSGPYKGMKIPSNSGKFEE